MANITDYLDWRGDIGFSAISFGEVDSLIFSEMCYVDLDGIVSPYQSRSILLSYAEKQYVRRHRGENTYIGAIMPKDIIPLFIKAGRTERFGKVKVCGYVNHVNDQTQSQFSAITYVIDDNNICVAYRGTDDTIVGWKENFNMSFMLPVPAQLEALSYLEKVAKSKEGNIYICGHSKGGNLAVYAATMAPDEIKSRIVSVYSHDGPGFTAEFIESEEYASIRDRIHTIIPQTSIVGMLLEHEETYEVVKSNQTGLLQHDSFSWEVLGPSFIHLDNVTKESRYIDRTIKQWLGEMSNAEREEFVEALFETLNATKAKTLTDLNTDRKKLVKAWSGLDAGMRNTVLKYIRLLFSQSAKSIISRKSKATTKDEK